MIASVAGPVLQSGLGNVVVAVGGIGVRVEVPVSLSQRLAVGSDAKLQTTLIVREDSLTLFGFEDVAEREAFDILLGVSGIGPRLAQGALEALGADGLAASVASGDLAVLQKIPGVGKKTAQRMVLEIGDKLGPPTTAPTKTDSSAREMAAAGLEQLGWPRAAAESAVDSVDAKHQDVESILRAALALLGPRHG